MCFRPAILSVVCYLLAPFLVAADKPLVDQLPQGALQSAFQILRRDYIRRDELTYDALNRAALQGVLERLNFGAELVPAGGDGPPAAPHVHAEFLAPDIAYLRPETFSAGESGLFEKELTGIVAKRARHLIVDLRATKSAGSFDEAARMLECFVPAGELIFKLKQTGRDGAELFISKREPVWSGEVVALIDGDTNNAAEAFAVCLAQRKRTLLIGEPTRGAAVRHTDVKLDDEVILRYASAEMLLPDDSPVFKKGVTPAIAVSSQKDEKWKAFSGSQREDLKAFVTDRVRPRFNEAALVRSKNPEIEDYIRRSNGQPLPGDEGQVRDLVTQRALDLLRSSDFVVQFSLNWSLPPKLIESASGTEPKAIPSEP
ncbi:MAG: S41 family peptidase [Verrucomicrobiaceae bacterium]